MVPTLLALVGSAVAVNVIPPRYTGETRILLQSGESYYTRPSGSSDRDGAIDDRDVVSQVQIVTSRDLAHDAIERSDLRGNPEFDPAGPHDRTARPPGDPRPAAAAYAGARRPKSSSRSSGTRCSPFPSRSPGC